MAEGINYQGTNCPPVQATLKPWRRSRLDTSPNRWSSERRMKLASIIPSRDRGGQDVKEEGDSQLLPDEEEMKRLMGQGCE